MISYRWTWNNTGRYVEEGTLAAAGLGEAGELALERVYRASSYLAMPELVWSWPRPGVLVGRRGAQVLTIEAMK